MYKISWYDENGFCLNTWETFSYEPVWDYRGIEFKVDGKSVKLINGLIKIEEE